MQATAEIRLNLNYNISDRLSLSYFLDKEVLFI